MIFFSLFFVLLHHVSPSPIVKILKQSDHGADYLDFTIPQDHCVLTPKLGDSGTRQFLEECEGIGKIDQKGRKTWDVQVLIISREIPNSPQAPE